MNKNPNPQGKGLTPVLDSLQESRAMVPVLAKDIGQISHELFTSLFVLHSQFQFKPVIGKCYYLYHKQSIFKLSLVSPKEWGNDAFGQFVGECMLQKDITWTLNIDASAARDPVLMSLIAHRRAEFEQVLKSNKTIDEILPFYLDTLPFYQRVFASGMAASLRTSLVKSGIQGLSFRQAERLPGPTEPNLDEYHPLAVIFHK